MPIAVVTDSTANLPDDVAGRHGVRVIPLMVQAGDHSYREGVDIAASEITAMMRAGVVVTTAHPGPEVFLAVYRALADGGADGVVSAHVSSHLSGACNAARLAALESPIPVRVVDSLSVGMGLGFAVLAGQRAADRGGDLDAVAQAVADTAAEAGVWFCVDNLDYLKRGGRIGSARALLANALAIKPILTISGGEVAPFDRVRTTARAMARLEDVAVEHAVLVPSDVAIHHADALDRAEALAERLRMRLPGTEIQLSALTSAVTAHTGPGTVSVVVAPAEPEGGS